MAVMTKEEESLIQNKIDGLLTPEEEELFNELIERSLEARKLYQELLEVHRSINADAQNIPVVDFSKEIMKAIASKQEVGQGKSKIIRFLAIRSNLLAYAAILFVGLFIGSIATYLGTSTNQPLNKSSLSGTIADESMQNFRYNDDTTEIAVREIADQKLKYTLIAINTIDSLQCCITTNSKTFNDKNIELWFGDGKFRLTETTENGFQYLCSGSVVFQINRMENTNAQDPVLVSFMRKGQIIRQMNLR